MTFYPVAEPQFIGNEKKYLMDCIDSTWISSTGKYIDLFEKKFAEFIGTKHAITVANGTVALHLILKALDVGEGDEVIVPDFTYVASANSVKYVGAKPVFVDADQKTFNIDAKKIEEKITEKTKAIMPVHIFGNPCDMDLILEIADKHSLLVIEDAAEAHGAIFNEKKAGSFGIANSFSFYGNKTMTTGEGGMITTNDDSLNEKLRILKNQGQGAGKKYYHEVLGYNYRMTNLQAAIGLAQLEKLGLFVNKKQQINAKYRAFLAGLADKGTLSFQEELPKGRSSYWMTSLILNKAPIDSFAMELKKADIETRPFFVPMDHLPFYEKSSFPITSEISSKGIMIPSSVSLKDDDIDYICKVIKQIIAKNKTG